MAISTVTNRVAYQGNGTSAVFSFPYQLHSPSDIAVFAYNSSLTTPGVILPFVLNAAGGYGFTFAGNQSTSGVYPNGGNVTLNSSPNADTTIILFRSSVVTNDFFVSQTGQIPSSGLNNAIDKLTVIAQRLQDLVTRSMRLPDGFHGSFDPTLPSTMNAIGSSTIITTGDSTGFAVGPTADQIFGANSAAIRAASSALSAYLSEVTASAQAVLAGSGALSASNSAFQAASAALSANQAVAVIGSSAYWGAEAQSAALSAFNQSVLSASSSLSASNQAVLAGSAVVSASNQAALANSAAVSASNQAALAGSAALSASNSAASLTSQVTSVTANYNATTADRYIYVSSSNFTVNLYGVSGNAGREISIIKSDFSNVMVGVTIAGSNALINEAATTTINTQWERLDLLCNGSSWTAKRTIPQPTGSSVPIVSGFGTVTANVQYSQRSGDSLHAWGTYNIGSSTATAATIQILYSGTVLNVDTTRIGASQLCGTAGVGAAFDGSYAILTPTANSSAVGIGVATATTNMLQATTGSQLFTTPQGGTMQYSFRVPIVGWKG